MAKKLIYRTPGGSIGIKPTKVTGLIEKVKVGLPYEALARFQKASNLPPSEIAQLVQMAPRTLIRRKSEGKLKPDESDRLLRASMLFEKAVALLEGDVAAARQWLKTPQSALADQTPLQFASTEVGAREVEDLIGRLEHGVFT